VANAANSANIGPYALRVQADGLFNANDVAQRLVNMRLSEAQTLRAVWGPTAYVPTKTQEDYYDAPAVGTRPGSRTAPVGGSRLTVLSAGLQALDHTIPYYGFKQHGIFHAVMASGREILLLHTGDELWEWRGWARNWRRIIATPSGSHGITGNLPDKSQSDFPTQFVFTGNGIAIVPQQGRAYFYDGHYIAPLGFASLPASPTARGPSSSGASFSATEGTVNDVGYAHSSADRRALFDNEYQVEELDHTSMTDGFGDCRLGTITVLPVTVPTDLESAATGWVNAGEWRCAAQYVDRWGNLSAMSTPSSAVTIDVCPSVVAASAYVVATGTPDSPVAKRVLPSRKRVQIKWEGISTGPDHCIGRRLYRTKDTQNTGDTALYYLSQNALSVPEYATLPDNVVTQFPDNIPDTWLGDEAVHYLAVPEFRLATMALGRLWIGNLKDAPATTRPSEPGFWGTFKKGFDLTPDPTSEITALVGVPEGLLVCTATSTFLVTSSDDGQAFKHVPVSKTIGCAAPGSAVTMPAGGTIFLGRDGFYLYQDGALQFVSPELRRTMKRLTFTRLRQAVGAYDARSREYRCWVSLDGNEHNNQCFVYGPTPGGQRGWRERTDIVADSVCVTRDHRRYMLVGGHLPEDAGRSGVYLLDHDASPDVPSVPAVRDREALVETGWLEASDSDKAKTSYVVYLWLRETENTSLTIEVLRNWREEVVDVATVVRYSEKDIPDFWATTKLGAGTWRDKRPFWTRAAIHVPSAESVKFRIRGTGGWEFVGIQIKMAPRYYGGAQLTP
tara:strand:- start:395 stop:2755 length:2361 start_codon:yes stop_codon:yes gene_type:complete